LSVSDPSGSASKLQTPVARQGFFAVCFPLDCVPIEWLAAAEVETMASAKPAQAKAAPAGPWRVLRWNSRQLAYRERLTEEVSLTLLRIPAGRFSMGAPEGEEGSSGAERPVHEVTLGDFLLGQTPVTQAQWRAVAGWQRQEGKAAELWPQELVLDPLERVGRDAERFRGDQRPVVGITWAEAMAFCERLKLRTEKNYALPSEAQWEYACRAGTTSPFHFGATISPELANYDGTTAYGEGPTGTYREQTTDVASFSANAWGLHDMHGNVWEWCEDHWHDSYEGAPTDGSAWVDAHAQEDERRLLRGGSWFDVPHGCRSAGRYWYLPDIHFQGRGFRVCCLPQDLILYA